MNSILKVSIANIKKRKTQSMLIAILLILSTLIFISSVAILQSINAPYEKCHKELKASHISLVFNRNSHNPNNVYNWWKSQDEVESVSDIMPCVNVNSGLLNGEKINSQFKLCEIPKSISNHEKISKIEGGKNELPKFGEVWIPTAFAYSNNIKIGDKISIPIDSGIKDLKVTGIVVDPIFSTQMINPTRFWCAPGSLSMVYNANMIKEVYIGIRLKNFNDESKLWGRFEEFLKTPYSGVKLTYDMVKMAFTFLYQIIAAIMIVFATILLLIAMYILFAVISDSIINDYKTIGILKSTGYTPFNVIMIYIVQMIIIALFSIPLGVLISIPIIMKIMGDIIKALGITNLNNSFSIIILITSMFVFLIVMITTYFSSRKAGKIKPSIAIKFGSMEIKIKKKSMLNFNFIKKLPLPFYIGINEFINNKRRMIFSFLALFGTSLVLFFSLNMYKSLASMSDNPSKFGFENSDVLLEKTGKRIRIENSTIIEKVKKDPRVKNVGEADYITYTSIPKDKDNNSMSIIGNCYSGDIKELGLENIEGDNPKKVDEISIAYNTSKKYHKKVGDKFDLYINEKHVTFKVTGIYQSLNNLGQGYRLQKEAIQAAVPDYIPSTFHVTLKNSNDSKQFIIDIERELGETIDAKETKVIFNEVFKPVISNIKLVVYFISIIFGLVLIVAIFTSTLLFIHREKKNFGIYKTVGFTPLQARISITSRYFLVSIVALILGSTISFVILPYALVYMLMSMGVTNFPIQIDMFGCIMVIPMVLGITFLSSWIPSGKILKVNPRLLINE